MASKCTTLHALVNIIIHIRVSDLTFFSLNRFKLAGNSHAGCEWVFSHPGHFFESLVELEDVFRMLDNNILQVDVLNFI